MQKVPALFNCLPAKVRATLSGCNRQLRACLRNMTAIVVLNKASQIATLKSSEWPLLKAVVLRNAPLQQYSQQTFGGRFQLVARLRLPDCRQGSCDAVFLVRPQQKQENLPPSQQLSTALLLLHQPEYAALVRLELCCPCLDLQIMTRLVTPKLEELSTLNLSKIELDSTAVCCLATGCWPNLSLLDLSMCGLDTAAMGGLVQGQWPKLENLNLSANPLLDGAAMSLLASANWPSLSTVHMKCMQLSSGSFDWMKKQWAQLSQLDLRWTGISAALVSEFAHTYSSRISILDLTGNELGSAAVAALVTASLPHLVALYLCGNNLDAAAAQWLSRGSWPRLQDLDLDDNLLDNAAMCHVVNAQWVCLKWLCLCLNSIDSDGFGVLVHEDWPCLESLQLDVGLGDETTWCLLDLDPAYLPVLHAKVIQQGIVTVPRLQQDSQSSWERLPSLTRVEFCCHKCPTNRLADGTRQRRKNSSTEPDFH